MYYRSYLKMPHMITVCFSCHGFHFHMKAIAIEMGSIWYKNTDVHQVVVETFGDTVILWNRITLEAEVRGNVVSNEFTVTEVYQDQDGKWSLLNLTFSSVRDTHSIEE